MNVFRMSRLTQLDVKWTGYHQGNAPLANYEHSNPYFELMMVTEGPIYLQTGNKKWELASGECFLLEPWEHHTAWKLTHEQAGFFWVQFVAEPLLVKCSPEQASNPLSFEVSRQELRTGSHTEIEHLLLPCHFQPKSRYELLSLFEKLHDEMEHPQGYFRYRSTLLLGQIIHLIAEDTMHQKHGRELFPASFMLYRQLVNYINETYNTELDRDDIERFMNRKYEYLCFIFKKHSGISITTYVHQLRIQRAKYLLHNSDLEIKDIAQAVGFQDPYYFSRLFKRLEHCSPSEYRKNQPLREEPMPNG